MTRSGFPDSLMSGYPVVRESVMNCRAFVVAFVQCGCGGLDRADDVPVHPESRGRCPR